MPVANPPSSFVHRLLGKLGKPRRDLPPVCARDSYSQCGEDRIIAFLCDRLNLSHPRYLDVGANDPAALSNTYLFYLHGSRGVCVEPNPVLHASHLRMRPKDVCLNVGIGSQAQASLPFYQFSPRFNGLSTFSQENARQSEIQHSVSVEAVLQIPIRDINGILREHFSGGVDFLSVDVEGLDMEVFQAIDFANYIPTIICAETIYHQGDETIKDQRLMDFILSKGYRVFADTYVNSIFVRADLFPKV